MKTIGILSVALLAAASAMAVDYDFETGTEGWTAAAPERGVGDFGASNGMIGFDYITPTQPFDPMLISPTVEIDSENEHWLALTLNLTAATNDPIEFQIFFSNQAGGFSELRSRKFNVIPNQGMQTLAPFDMSDTQGTRDPWEGTATQFRIDPGNSSTGLIGYRLDVDRIAITDDVDLDGIEDDAEYQYWGDLTSADDTTDHDANGILDSVEIAWGLDPTVDEGEAMPAAGAGALLATALGLLAVALKRRA